MVYMYSTFYKIQYACANDQYLVAQYAIHGCVICVSWEKKERQVRLLDFQLVSISKHDSLPSL